MATETIIQREAPEIEAYKLGLLEQAKQLTSAPPTGGLPDITVQGPTDLQSAAFQGAENVGIGAYSPYLQSGQATQALAGGMFMAGAGAPTEQQIQSYMNPYQKAVGDEISRAFNIQRAQAGQQAVGAGAFGGGRAAIQQAEIGRNEAQALAQAQAQNFIQAQQAAQNQMQRQLAAGQGMAQLGVQQAGLGELAQGMDLKGLSAQAQLGEQQRSLLQAQDEAARQTEMQNIYEPYKRLGFYSDMLRGAPSTQVQSIQSAEANPSILNQILGAGIGGLSLYGAANKAVG